mgnify:CR=1 FL=1
MERMMIEMEDLVKKFPHTDAAQKKTWKTAEDGVCLSVQRGEVFGLLGPNGAGKTTIIRMLTMQTRPTSGTIRIDGRDIRADERGIKALIGVVPQHVNFDQELTVWDNMELHARLYRMGRAERAARIGELLAEMELAEVRNDGVRRLSGGMKRRAVIARAAMTDPAVLLLDEPSAGLDPDLRQEVWALIRKLRDAGKTLLLTTHYMEEAERLCGRIAFLRAGRLRALDTADGIRAAAGDAKDLEQAFLRLSHEEECP